MLVLVREGGTPTLEEIMLLLKKDQRLSPVRRRDLVSALRRVAAACGLPTSQMFADPLWLRQKLAATSEHHLGRTAKTRANVLSNAMSALALAGMAERRPQVERAAHWQPLWQRLSASGKIALGSFLRFCSFRAIAPPEVNDQVVVEFLEAIKQSSLRKKPEDAIRELTLCWNNVALIVPGWQVQRLTVPNRALKISPPLNELPASLRADLAHYLKRLEGGDVLEEDGSPSLSPATIKSRELQVRRFFGELVVDGVGVHEIPDLGAMVQPDMAYRGLRAMIARKNGSSGMIHNMAYALLVIAKHHVRLAEQDLNKIRKACSKLKVERLGMTAKNRARLRQFDDQDNLNRLLDLPRKLLLEVQRKPMRAARAARLVEIALAIELLWMTALRIKNLASLRLDQNLQWTRSSKRGVCHLVVDRRDIKNQVDRDYELEGETVDLLKTFIDKHRPRLSPNLSPWLFARGDGSGPVGPVVLSKRIKKLILERTGLTVNVHLFRALAAKLLLDRYPGNYEVARRVLGHKRMSTTVAAYTGMERISAAKLFDRTVRDQRELARSKRGTPKTPQSCRP
jgi:integrase